MAVLSLSARSQYCFLCRCVCVGKFCRSVCMQAPGECGGLSYRKCSGRCVQPSSEQEELAALFSLCFWDSASRMNISLVNTVLWVMLREWSRSLVVECLFLQLALELASSHSETSVQAIAAAWHEQKGYPKRSIHSTTETTATFIGSFSWICNWNFIQVAASPRIFRFESWLQDILEEKSFQEYPGALKNLSLFSRSLNKI